MTPRRPIRRRAVEKDATANVDIADLYAVATRRYGSPATASEQVERMCTDLERIALNPDGSIGAAGYLRVVADELWLDSVDRPDSEDLARTMAKIVQRTKDKKGLLWCASHGWQEPFLWGKCAECPCQMSEYQSSRTRDAGRPRVYCSSACRQRAYRRRRKGHRSAHD
ncbi:hypothetical protein SAMN04244553_5375 [Nocardia amikacinitolerans]|uniref:CGNR zinc finger domain-containing protein n=1 Tax=Nocardia amikacinitolerans TaxID=756689 RepID=A0A285LVA4_9NOCA|nr:hypothetical protein [Nocardia amikacinitolerans]SNY88403.1 hypothetical protein SAMN04244553_5375 [Nocardia amikacinitolerans]